MKQTCVTKIN